MSGLEGTEICGGLGASWTCSCVILAGRDRTLLDLGEHEDRRTADKYKTALVPSPSRYQ